MKRLGCGIGLVALMMGSAADAQSATNMAALKGLAPVSALSNGADGKAALGSNFTVTGGIALSSEWALPPEAGAPTNSC